MSEPAHAQVENVQAEISFFVPGVCVPKGSTRARVNRKTGRAYTFNANPQTKPWQELVSLIARRHAPAHPWPGPIGLQADFFIPRKADHFRKDGTVKPTAAVWCDKRPDLDKYLRAVKDALSKLVYIDDGQVAICQVKKVYGDEPGVRIACWRIN